MTHPFPPSRPVSPVRRTWVFLLLACLFCLPLFSQLSPKREFRGVWLHTLNGDYQGMDEARFRTYLCGQLDLFQRAGINAVLFQVRPEADALYKSSYEPWSRFLTGTQGKDPGFDPMAICIEECHRRFMEFHAWINPYRAQLNRNTQLSPDHPYYAHPEWFFEYDNKLFFNPGLPECRSYIRQVVRDIVERYDVDGVHVDDYFYPYPSASREPIPDEATYARYGAPRGMSLPDWRRYNVNMLIQELQETIHETKPYVKFGVSPFGIYRNRKSAGDGFGSETNGLQNYDDLYADILLWLRYGWVDYIVPQLYWEMGHRLADYETLVRWWASCSYGRLLFIGQDVDRCAKHASLKDPNTNQFRDKAAFTRLLPGISGNCYWSGKVLLQNPGNIYTLLEREFNRFPALPPIYPQEYEPADDEARAAAKRKRTSSPPKANPVRKLKAMWTEDGYVLIWRAPKVKNPGDEPRFYVIYRFGKDEPVDLENPTRIVGYSNTIYYKLPYEDGSIPYRYVVTAVNRFNAESKGKSKNVKL